MADVSFTFDCEKGRSDIQIADGDNLIADELQTAVEISIFSNSRALNNPDPRVRKMISALQGWWADAVDGEALGSLYWTFQREKQTQEVLNGVKEAFENSLQWLIDDGVCSDITIENEWIKPDRMYLKTTLTKPNESDVNFSWEFAWKDF